MWRKFLPLLSICFLSVLEPLKAEKCIYYPSFPNTQLFATTDCRYGCCRSYPIIADDACCISSFLTWIAYPIVAVAVSITCVAVGTFVCVKFKKTKRTVKPQAWSMPGINLVSYPMQNIPPINDPTFAHNFTNYNNYNNNVNRKLVAHNEWDQLPPNYDELTNFNNRQVVDLSKGENDGRQPLSVLSAPFSSATSSSSPSSSSTASAPNQNNENTSL